ncbi:hypothetical protein DFH09DRAFT_1079742 [Mycena vulgaris]|nr:hypothetical protein DFH09DRAFT_1079742 [Mycena vulgaris]
MATGWDEWSHFATSMPRRQIRERIDSDESEIDFRVRAARLKISERADPPFLPNGERSIAEKVASVMVTGPAVKEVHTDKAVPEPPKLPVYTVTQCNSHLPLACGNIGGANVQSAKATADAAPDLNRTQILICIRGSGWRPSEAISYTDALLRESPVLREQQCDSVAARVRTSLGGERWSILVEHARGDPGVTVSKRGTAYDTARTPPSRAGERRVSLRSLWDVDMSRGSGEQPRRVYSKQRAAAGGKPPKHSAAGITDAARRNASAVYPQYLAVWVLGVVFIFALLQRRGRGVADKSSRERRGNMAIPASISQSTQGRTPEPLHDASVNPSAGLGRLRWAAGGEAKQTAHRPVNGGSRKSKETRWVRSVPEEAVSCSLAMCDRYGTAEKTVTGRKMTERLLGNVVFPPLFT